MNFGVFQYNSKHMMKIADRLSSLISPYKTAAEYGEYVLIFLLKLSKIIDSAEQIFTLAV